MKTILTILAVLTFSFVGHAQLGNPANVVLNSTNSITADATNSYAVPISTQRGKDLALQIRFKLISGAETGSVLFKFSKSVDGSNAEDTPFFTWTIPANGSNYVSQCTNLTIDAIPTVFVTQVVTTNDVAMTNIAIRAFVK